MQIAKITLEILTVKGFELVLGQVPHTGPL